MTSPSLPAMVRRQSDVMALIAQDAPESELLVVLHAAAADTATEGLAAELERFAEAALSLHRARAEDQARSAGLAALIDTITDLATHRDLEVLLPAICRRARSLLGTDVAYIMLTDPERGDSYVHTTDGVVSEEFRSMRVGSGVGIGGRVASTGQPETTPNYRFDGRLMHSADVDQRVSAEGLQGVAAAPLRRGAYVMGVLFACSRTTRRFAAREVSLLAGLANHAAVAIDNARLLRDAQQAAAELATAEAAARAHADHVEKVARARHGLAAVALNGASVPEILDAALSHLTGSMEVDVPEVGLRVLRSSADTASSLEHGFEVDISAGPERLGIIRVLLKERGGTEQEITAYTAGLIANVVLRQQARSDADLLERARILEGLIEGGDADTDVRRLFGRIGVSPDEPLSVLVWAPLPNRSRRAWLEVARRAATQRSVAATASGHLTVVVPGEDAELAAEQWHAWYRAGHPGEDAPTIGAAISSGGASDIQRATRRGERALQLVTALGRTGIPVSAENLGLLGHLLEADARPDLALFVKRALEPLDSHDAAGRAPLTSTVEAFICNDGHLARAASDLHIHVNTLYRRLESVDTLLGAGWRRGDQRLELALALRIRELERKLVNGWRQSRS